MAFVYCNPNPHNNLVIDCVIRAVTIALDSDWYTIYDDICAQGRKMCDMPSSNSVWTQYLLDRGFKMESLINTCPFCYTVKDFTRDHPTGIFILCSGDHAVTVINGNHYDIFDSSDVVPIFYFYKEW